MPTRTDRPSDAILLARSPQMARVPLRPLRAVLLIHLATVGLCRETSLIAAQGPGLSNGRFAEASACERPDSKTSLFETVPEDPEAATSGFTWPVAPPPRPGFLAVARDSIFGMSDPPPWRPLALGSVSEGWRDPWVPPPNGSSGALRKGWIGAPDGVSIRLFIATFAEDFRVVQGGNAYRSRFDLYTPLSRRLLVITSIPTINSNSPSFTLPTWDPGSSLGRVGRPPGRGTSFGDLTVTSRLMLAESQDFSLVAQLTAQAPTGSTSSGAGRAIITPGIQFWSDIGRRRALRGSFNVGSGLNGPGGGTTLLSQLAIGRTYTSHETPLIGDLTFYLAANVIDQISPTTLNTVTLGPGFRVHLGHEYNLLGAATIPVTAPFPYAVGCSIWFAKNF